MPESWPLQLLARDDRGARLGHADPVLDDEIRERP